MKALAWRRWISIAAGMLVLAAALQPALAAKPTRAVAAQPFAPVLPDGLPVLPRLGEVMQRDLRSGLALRGFDPVAYQAVGHAVAGRSDFELEHGGAVWRFASAANREAFRDAPAIYEPAYAGFDAAVVAEGAAAETDPRQFAIVENRLFLFRSAENRAAFLADPGLRQAADGKWGEVYETIAR
jgi:YHS domain-containing protein